LVGCVSDCTVGRNSKFVFKACGFGRHAGRAECVGCTESGIGRLVGRLDARMGSARRAVTYC
jgi:hypothetical protein